LLANSVFICDFFVGDLSFSVTKQLKTQKTNKVKEKSIYSIQSK